MAPANFSQSDSAVAALVSAALRELLDAMGALCTRVQDCSEPFGHDEYDRLGLLLPSMLGAAEELCRAADGLLANAAPVAARDADDPTPYAQLAQALVQTRLLARRLLRPLRPEIHEHSDAIALINRLSAESASVRGKCS